MSDRRDNCQWASEQVTRIALDNVALIRPPGQRPGTRVPQLRIVAGIVLVILLAGIYGLLSQTGTLATLLDGGELEARIESLGLLGPLAVVGLMTGAIVMSPIPSAPIALAAGAAFGHVWGTIYVLVGAETGALIAFAIARLVGYEMLQSWFRGQLALKLLGSQNTLMGIVFVTRLIPFISFDLVSYAAGLTPLTTWRFAIATLAGIAPASFLLAHFGVEMVSADPRRIAISVLALGSLTLVPVMVRLIRSQRQKRSAEPPKDSQF